MIATPAHPGLRTAADQRCRLIPSHLPAAQHAHGRGVIHCDVKPANIRLNQLCDRAVLTDWGLARSDGCRPEACMHGTPEYASPEQLTGYCRDSISGRRNLCPASDVWSLGVLLFEMCTGHVPFHAAEDGFADLVRLVVECRYTVPDYVPHAAAQLIHTMLQPSPNDRATTAGKRHIRCGARRHRRSRHGGCDAELPSRAPSQSSPPARHLHLTDPPRPPCAELCDSDFLRGAEAIVRCRDSVDQLLLCEPCDIEPRDAERGLGKYALGKYALGKYRRRLRAAPWWRHVRRVLLLLFYSGCVA